MAWGEAYISSLSKTSDNYKNYSEYIKLYQDMTG